MKLVNVSMIKEGEKEQPAKQNKIKGQRHGRTAFWFLLPNLSGFLVFTLTPILAVFVLSLFEWSLIAEPKFVGLRNYIYLFTSDSNFIRVLLNTIFFTIVYLTLNLLVSLTFAAWLNQKIKGIAVYRAILFLPVLVPPVAIALIWQFMYEPSVGLINHLMEAIGLSAVNWLGNEDYAMFALIIMCVWQQFGYNMLIFLAALKGIPQTILEAASIDGAKPLTKFFKISIPSISPAILFAMVMTLITSFQIFDQVFILTNGGPGYATEVLGLYIYKNAFEWFQMGYGAALAVVLFVIILIVTLIQLILQKKWVHYETK
ncbi:carbohydrate ABC transporter permease [Gracilibacillus alcaliphilus]|uniref:carbohydrate ABC transporter permease n=1 Tax=Gracilibacillus alcaliphilus TaxID=1401441 RepID=UPI00195C5776|nr:sugar ABC transporter permease [Gracilibacillus alcaliphilus]MBM7676754.1 multiple sugar transport system permease protein [Gracilibacillus alcaliphilus]